MSETVELTDQNFDEEVLKSDVPVLVDFWADWCQPCKAISPIVQQIARDYDGRIKVGKLDVDSNNATSTTYGIRGIPALLIFSEGKPMDQVVGVAPKSVISKKIDEILEASSGG